ncbi:MAG TPA: MFS transporter [Ktedonobacterales bacterium]|nr:MFS transporter [Ktedonobacterales bacterium]
MHPTTDHRVPAQPGEAGLAPTSTRRGPLVNRGFALLWTGYSVSIIGDFLFDTTLVVWIALGLGRDQPWAPAAVSGVLLASALPIALIGPVAGVFVDRWDKRRTMMVMDVLRAGIVGLLVLVSGALPLPFVPGGRLPLGWTLGAIYATVVLVNALGRFAGPSTTALIGDLVPEEERARASGMQQAAMSLALIIGPGAAPPLYLAVGPQWTLLFEAASFLVSLACLRAIVAPPAAHSVKPGQRGHVLRELGAGLRFFAQSRILMTLAVSIVLVMLGGGALNALDIFFATQNLHASATVYGLLGASFGLGAILGSLLLSGLTPRLGVARVLSVGTFLIGMLVLVYSRLTAPAPAIALLFVFGICNAGVNVAAGPLVLHATPRAFVGRVSAVLNPLGALASVLSMALAGVLDSTLLSGFHARLLGLDFGPVDTIFSAAGLLAVLGGAYAMVRLRGVRLAGERGGPTATSEDGQPVAEAALAAQ